MTFYRNSIYPTPSHLLLQSLTILKISRQQHGPPQGVGVEIDNYGEILIKLITTTRSLRDCLFSDAMNKTVFNPSSNFIHFKHENIPCDKHLQFQFNFLRQFYLFNL